MTRILAALSTGWETPPTTFGERVTLALFPFAIVAIVAMGGWA